MTQDIQSLRATLLHLAVKYMADSYREAFSCRDSSFRLENLIRIAEREVDAYVLKERGYPLLDSRLQKRPVITKIAQAHMECLDDDYEGAWLTFFSDLTEIENGGTEYDCFVVNYILASIHERHVETIVNSLSDDEVAEAFRVGNLQPIFDKILARLLGALVRVESCVWSDVITSTNVTSRLSVSEED